MSTETPPFAPFPEPFVGPATLWAATSDLVAEHRRVFLRASRRWVRTLQRTDPLLECWVDERYEQAKRWLRWLDFVEDGRKICSPMGVWFVSMVKR